ncbi:Glycosyltransferase involved in cell wall bisynthesis [Pseudobutyrivibrio sp. UC1225]|uniref:glycosyltransferase n=1 Tax=Pseudobutyrivibrio sp. UC1225 TaxID=1798185 RepID=UPI0008E8FCE9|nr:glycosyltransferase [Pseudobutyrivibrio sp. UC1225]SFO21798.1 Glycosyltransferase involved in cell wall bisynthesis [Pseudobutyrivibrio sp. UC1225]
MKKICYITTVPSTINAFILESTKYIHEHTDWDITFVCDEDKDFGANLPEYIYYHPIKMERGISFAGIGAMLEMKRFFKEQKFDMIQYSTPNASLYASMAGKMAKVPVRLYCQWGMAFVGFSGIKRAIFKAVEKYVCSSATWIEPDSKSNLDFSHAEGLYPEDKGSVIWNGSACGVKLDKFQVEHKQEWRALVREKLEIPEDAFVFGYVGRITRDKGINELLAAAKDLLTVEKKTYLLFVGPDEADVTIDAELMTWAKEEPRVIFAGFVNDVERYLAAMDTYVLPSYREGFGMGVVEAEAMAVPVIVTNIPGPTDAMIKDVSGYVIEKKSVVGLIEAMKRIMSADLKSMGKAGRKFVEEGFEQQEFFRRVLEDRKKLMGE